MEEEKTTLVSIIIVSYNSEKYILDCLESIYNQTYGNIELIVSDDASEDETLEIVYEWLTNRSTRFVNVSLLRSETNRGVSYNCNKGVSKASGEWVKLIGADDVLMPNCIEEFLNFVNITPNCNIAFSGYISFYEKVGDIVNRNSDPGSYFWDSSVTAEDQLKMLLKFNRVPACSSFINRRFIETVGGFDESIPMVEDIPMWIKITYKGYKLYYVNKEIVGYRKRRNSLTDKTIKYQNVSTHQIKQYILISERYRLPLSTGLNKYINFVGYYLAKRKLYYYDKSKVKFRLYFSLGRSWSHLVKFVSLYIFKS